MDIQLIGSISAVGVIIGIIQALKNFGLDTKLAPAIAVVLGLAASFGLAYFGETKAFEAIVLGLAVGLSAVGLYSSTKNTLEGYRNSKEEE